MRVPWTARRSNQSMLKEISPGCSLEGMMLKLKLQYSCLENPMDGGAWWAAVHGVAKSRTRLSDFTFTFHFHALEKEMATHSSVLAWRIPGPGGPCGLPSMGSQSRTQLKRCSSSSSRHKLGLPWWLSGKESSCQCRRCRFNPWTGKMPLRRKWQPTPVFLPGESHGGRSLVGYSPRGCKELDTTD